MKRNDFKKIIKLRSFWKIDKRKGNYKLPNGCRLNSYVEELVYSQLKLDKLAIRENGDICPAAWDGYNKEKGYFDDYTLMPAFEVNEVCTYDEMEKRIERLVYEIIE